MFGIFCRGLHCAGCGKGIPASVVILGIIAALFARNAGAVSAVFEEMVIGAAVVVFLAVVISCVAIARLFRHGENVAVMGGRWNGRGYTELTGHYQSGQPIAQWPDVEYRPQIAPRHTVPMDIITTDYTVIPRHDE